MRTKQAVYTPESTSGMTLRGRALFHEFLDGIAALVKPALARHDLDDVEALLNQAVHRTLCEIKGDDWNWPACGEEP